MSYIFCFYFAGIEPVTLKPEEEETRHHIEINEKKLET